MEVDSQLVHPTLRNLLYGQFANLFKFALWWTTLAPLTYALLDGSTEAIGVGRICYNVALCMLSPIGGILVERVHPRTILLRAAAVRFLIWCVFVPLLWFLFQSSIVTVSHTAIYVIFNILLFFDGASVALSTVLDIDLCGVDVVSGVYGIDVTDENRNQFNSRQELFFAVCFVVFAPGMAFLGLAIHDGFKDAKSTIPGIALESGTLVSIFFITFLVATILQYYFFSKFPMGSAADSGNDDCGDKQQQQKQLQDEEPSPAKEVEEGGAAGEDGPPPSFLEQVKSVPNDLKESLAVILAHKPIMFRLIFLGLEIAFEDAAIVVVASQMGIVLPWLGNGDSVKGNIWTAVGVASGKLGAAIASFLMMKVYTPPENPRSLWWVFALIMVSCGVMFVFPGITDAHRHGHLSDNAARALFLVGFFVYFFLSTLPKLGLMGLLQSMVSQVENGPRVFGFIAIIATTFDALVIMALSVLFVKKDIGDSLWVTAFVYMTHGVLEFVTGPMLVLAPLQRDANEEADAAAGGKADEEEPRENQSLLAGGGAVTEKRSSRLDAATAAEIAEAGTFSQRTAAVPIGGADAERTAVMSHTTHSVGYASVTRKRSILDASAPGAGGGATPGRGAYGSSGRELRYTKQGSSLTPRSNK